MDQILLIKLNLIQFIQALIMNSTLATLFNHWIHFDLADWIQPNNIHHLLGQPGGRKRKSVNNFESFSITLIEEYKHWLNIEPYGP